MTRATSGISTSAVTGGGLFSAKEASGCSGLALALLAHVFLIIALTWVYLLATSVQNAFTDVVDVTGLLFAIFYALTALATIAYYRRRIFSGRRRQRQRHRGEARQEVDTMTCSHVGLCQAMVSI